MTTEKIKGERISLLLVMLIICSIQLSFPVKVYSQAFIIKGLVYADTIPIQNASVTFINNSTSQEYNATTNTSGDFTLNTTTSVKSNFTPPSSFELGQNYPNPFSSKTQIPYKLKSHSNVQVTIYDILGRVVKKFYVGAQAVGLHSLVWNGRNSLGEKAAPGIYFYRLQADGQSQVKKMVFSTGGNNLLITSPGLSSSIVSANTKTTNVNLQGASYTVKLDNTSSTYPLITPKQINNVEIQSDTSLNFEVNSYYQVTFYPDSSLQIIRGFGAANIVQWRPDMTSGEIQTAFGNGPGQLGFTILRLRIPPDSTSFPVNVPTAKAAYSMGVKLMATPWSPPAWMKTNNSTIAGTLKVSAYAAFAAHLKEFADYMASQGAPLYAVSVQNEPDAIVNYESCYWSPTDFLNFCKNNAQSIGTKVMMPESESFHHYFSDPTLEDSVAASHVSIIAGHLYGTSPSPYPLALSKGKDLWMTEYLDTDTSWTHDLATGKQINDCMNDGMNAYVWWYIIRFYGPIDEMGRVTKRGYVMSQFSKFIRPGYYRIKGIYTIQRNVFQTAYIDSASSKVVIVALNMNSYRVYQTFSVENGNMKSFTPYTTLANKNVEQENNIKVTNGGFTYALDPLSITTFVSN